MTEGRTPREPADCESAALGGDSVGDGRAQSDPSGGVGSTSDAVRRRALELVDVSKVYGRGDSQVRAVDGVSVRIDAGQAVGIVGPSGCGKSTLLGLMGTLNRPTTGQIRVGNWEVSSLRDDAVAAIRARTIGFVFQQFFLLPGRSALDNVADGLLYCGMPSSARREAAFEALRQVGVEHRARHTPGQLSGGECQRIAIARALVRRPWIILADEPTGNLDTRSGQSVLDLFSQLHDAGTTLVVITHDPAVAARFARVIAMRDGRVVHDAATPTHEGVTV